MLIINDDAIEFGQLYRSAAVLGAGDGLPPAARPELWAGQPGTRASHVSIFDGDDRRSTFDLFRRSWLLLADDECWCSAPAQAGVQPGIELECLRIGVDVRPSDPEALRTAFGLGPGVPR